MKYCILCLKTIITDFFGKQTESSIKGNDVCSRVYCNSKTNKICSQQMIPTPRDNHYLNISIQPDKIVT
jgi:hypothetical protein